MKVYFDNNATTPLHPSVKNKMIEFMDLYGNASSVHQFGREARKYIEDAREQVADFLDCKSSEIIFTSGGSESNNIVLKGIGCPANCIGQCHKSQHIITSVIEHPSVLTTCRCLEETGSKVTYLPVDKYGMVNPADVENAIQKDTVLITIMYANNEIGTIQPIKEIAAIARKHGVLMHTDAVQAAGKVEFSIKDLGVDYLSISGHKIYGPKGSGALYMRDGLSLCSLITGGHQEREIRAGTENNMGIIGLGEACRMMKQEMHEEIPHLLKLRTMLEKGITSRVPAIHLNGHPDKRLPGTVNYTFKYVEGESILLRLDMFGIAVSTGSACSSGSLDPSHVILSLGVNPEDAHGSIRFSLGRENNEEEIEYTIDAVAKSIEWLRKLSPLYPG
jgi:cysteine desulfurase